MYCPVCGDQTTQGLNYCKRCGASLGPTAGQNAAVPVGRLLGLLWPVVIVSLAGLIGLFATTAEVSKHGIDPKVVVAIAAFGGATVVGVVGLMVWLLLKLTNAAAPDRAIAARPVPDQIRAALPEPPIAVPSVTENTTRGFDQLKSGRRATN